MRRATELFEKQVKDGFGSPGQFDIPLMEHAFNESNPIIKINKSENEDEKRRSRWIS